jgi:8-oxo-dGTP pyrophosphatase MutT (NUDIX family)
MNNVYRAQVKDKLVTFTHLGNENLPDFSLVTSVSAVPFNKDGTIVAVNLRHRGLDLPGGHVEAYETTPEETMNREVMEEAYITLKDSVLIDVVESDYFESRKSYLLLYAAYVDEFKEFIPNDESSERVIVSTDEFIARHTAWYKELMKGAIDRGWKLLQDL